MLWLAVVLATVPPDQLITNPDFRDGLTGWGVGDAGQSAVRVEDSSDPSVGSRMVTVRGFVADAPKWAVALNQGTISNIPVNRRVELTFWARSAENARIEAYIQEVNPSYPDLVRRPITLTPEWRRYRLEAITNRDFAPGQLQVGVHTNLGPGTKQFGRFSFVANPMVPKAKAETVLEWSPATLSAWRASQVRSEVAGGKWILDVAPGPESRPWTHIIGAPIPTSVSVGDVLVVKARMRSNRRNPVSFHLEESTEPNRKFLSAKVSLTPEWQSFTFAGRATQSFEPGESQLAIFLGEAVGRIEIEAIAVENLGTADLDQVPQTIEYYPGNRRDLTWRAAANRRINEHRKANLKVFVVDRRGRPITGAQVRIQQQRHAFKFGTAGPAALLAGTGPDADRYRAFVAKHFNTFTFENDLKWNSLDPQDTSQIDAAFKWLEARRFHVRGHNLVWGSQQYLPAGLWQKSDAEIRQVIADRVRTQVNRYKGKIYLWDAVNEAVTERELWERLGWSEFANVFRLARAADPKVQLAYNDFNITEESTAGSGHREVAKQRIQYLLDQRAPVDVIGIQGHVSVPLTPMRRVVEILREMAQFGLPLEITEYDAGIRDEQWYAWHMEDFLTASFAEPRMQAFIVWGFWERAHWRSNEFGHLVRADWTPRPVMQAYSRLVFDEWWTRASGRTTSRDGSWLVRAFKGDHRVTVTANGQTVEQTVRLDQPRSVVIRVP